MRAAIPTSKDGGSSNDGGVSSKDGGEERLIMVGKMGRTKNEELRKHTRE
jgi:hypothetical protein